MFESLQLHDATFVSTILEWEVGRCTMKFKTHRAAAATLVFEGVSELVISRVHPWGPSISVNGVKEPGSGVYEIELQSGDVVRVRAKTWAFQESLCDASA